MSERQEIEIVEGHTPGPWTNQGKKGELQAVSAKNAKQRPTYICQCQAWTGSKRDHDEALANARLIAQAPQMQQEIVRLRERVEALEDAIGYAVRKCNDPMVAGELYSRVVSARQQAGGSDE